MTNLKNRRSLIDHINEKKAKYAVEVGVKYGGFSKFILKNTGIEKLYSIDPWEINEELTAKENPVTVYDICKENLSPYGERSEMIKAYSPQICSKFENEMFDFVYIDGLHDYESVKKDIIGWFPKVKKGGIIAGHDYSNHWPGVILAVDEFVKTIECTLYLTGTENGNVEGIDLDGGEPSWWIIKQ